MVVQTNAPTAKPSETEKWELVGSAALARIELCLFVPHRCVHIIQRIILAFHLSYLHCFLIISAYRKAIIPITLVAIICSLERMHLYKA